MTIKSLETEYRGLENKPSAQFIKDIRAAVSESTITNIALSAFLDRCLKSLTPEVWQICEKHDGLTQDDRNVLTLAGQIIAANVLILLDMRSYENIRSNLLNLLVYASRIVKRNYDFIGTAVKVMSFNLKKLGVNWSIIENTLSLDILSYNICNKCEFDTTPQKTLNYTGNGQVTIKDGRLSIMSSQCGDDGAIAFSLYDDKIRVITRNTRDEKLKGSESDNAEKLEDFANVFIRTQRDTGKYSIRSKQEFKIGDKVTLKYTGAKEDDEGNTLLSCEVLESDEPISGFVENEELIKGFYVEDLVPYLFVKDCFPDAVVTDIDGETYWFSIKDSYLEYAKRKAKTDNRSSVAFKAKAIRINQKANRTVWMTPHGYAAMSFILEGIKEGDEHIMIVHSIQNHNKDTYINICEPKIDHDTIAYWDADESLAEYVINIDEALKSIKNKDVIKLDDNQQKEIIRKFASLMTNCCTGNSLEKLRILLCSEFLLVCIEESIERIQTDIAYLKCCIEYAQTGNIGYKSNNITFSQEQEKVLKCLELANQQNSSYELASLIDKEGLESIGNQIASLILARYLSTKFQDEIKTTDRGLRNKICELLGVADQFRDEGLITHGKYGNGEGHKLEFKSSYVYRNDIKNEKVADLDYQGRGQVFETICGFLNADGGTLYIGVNDKTGDPIISEEFGIRADIKWLTENFDTIKLIKKQKLGHAVPKPDSLDHFVLFLNTEKELYFSETLQNNITIEATEDQDAIRIIVTPAKFEIAYIYKDKERTGGLAFIRDGSSTRPMSHHDMEVRMMDLMNISKAAKFAVTIREAIDNKQKLIFRRYYSGNSGEIKDRHVVPINLFYNNENVYCWDTDENELKQFRLLRIESIDVDEAGGIYSQNFKKGVPDVFRWILGEKPKHIKIRMEIGALNYLLEEYSNAKNLPENELYQEGDSNKWILDTYLENFGAIRRFYLGLADKIEILETEDSMDFIEDIKRYVKQHL